MAPVGHHSTATAGEEKVGYRSIHTSSAAQALSVQGDVDAAHVGTSASKRRRYTVAHRAVRYTRNEGDLANK